MNLSSGNTFNKVTKIIKTLANNYSLSGLTSGTPANVFGAGASVTIENNSPFPGVFAYSNDTYNVQLTISNTGTGTFTADLITANNDLIVTQNSGTLNACYTGDCKLAGDLVVNGTVAGVYSFGNGLATSGAMEFIGGAAQIVDIGGGVSALSFAKLNLNKTAPATVTMNTKADVTVSSTMTQGIIVMGSNTITFNDPSIVTGYNSTSFVDGLVNYLSGSGAVTFPTGCAVGNIYRPVTINFSVPDGPISKSARYFNSAAPSSTSVLTPITNVSWWEYWSVNASPSSNFTVTLPWKNADTGNPNYVTDVSKLRVSRFGASSQWQDNGGSSVSPPAAGTVTSSPINTASVNIGNLTLGSVSTVNQLSPPQCRWLPPSGSASWNTAANWACGHVPTAADMAIFDQGNSTCVLPAASPVGALELLPPYTGSIDLKGVTLNVNAIAPTVLSTGNIINSTGSGSLVINGGTFPVSISGITAAATAAVTVNGNVVTVGSSVFNGNFTSSSPTNISLTGNVTMGSLTFSANLDLNGRSMTINGNGVTNTFTNGSITNSGAANTVSITNSTTGGTTINGTTFGTGVNLNVNSSGTTSTTISGATTFNGTVTIQSPDLSLNGATFNGTTSTFTKTGASVSNWNGGNTFNGNATITVSAGTLNFPIVSQDTFNKDLTISRNSTINACASVNCQFGGNVLVNGSAGTFTFGNAEFIGSLPQAISSGGSIALPLNFSNMIVNKSVAEKVTLNTKIASDNVTFTKGIIASSGTNDIIINNSWSGGNNTSYVEGRVRHTAYIDFIYPTGDQGYFRPLQGATSRATSPPMAVTYHHDIPPNNLSLPAFPTPMAKMSDCEYWEVRDALGGSNSTGPFFFTMTWDSFVCNNPSYVTDPTSLNVVRLPVVSGVYATTWVALGSGGTTTSPPYTTGSIYFGFTDNNKEAGLVALGSWTNFNLPIELSEFSGKLAPEGVRLDWETASEINNDHFEIERSSNGADFEKIGTVDGHGTTTVLHKYSLLDQKPLSGLSYYRLKQVDFDGESTYSKVISISNFPDQDQNELLIYPIPVRDKLFLSMKADVRIVNMLGNVIFTGNYVDEINVEALVPGVYCIVRKSTGQALRFVKN
jgi:hypothetical protein